MTQDPNLPDPPPLVHPPDPSPVEPGLPRPDHDPDLPQPPQEVPAPGPDLFPPPAPA